MTAFGDRLAEAVRRRSNPICVGLDPRWASLPEEVRAAAPSADYAGRSIAYSKFCCEVIDVVKSLVPVVKPQVAFFEQLGPPGMAALGTVIGHARQAGLLVIVDAKRNDIGTTAEAYADAFLGADSAWGGDALTVSPYLGGDSLQPFVDAAISRDAGLFVLVKTSNPGGGQFQDLTAEGQTLYRHVAIHVQGLAARSAGASGYGAIGAVVGATYPEQLAELRAAMPAAWILVPGFGSQGGTARDAAPAFDAQGLGAIINNSRGLIFAQSRKDYATRFKPGQWREAIDAATREMIEQLRAETTAGRLSAG